MALRSSGRLLAVLAAAVVLLAGGIAAVVILTDNGSGGAPSARDRLELGCSIAQARGDMPTGTSTEDAHIDPEAVNELALELVLIESAGTQDSAYAAAGKSAEAAYEKSMKMLRFDEAATDVEDAEKACPGLAPRLPKRYADRLDRYVDFGCRLGPAIHDEVGTGSPLPEAAVHDLQYVGQVGFMLRDADRDDLAEPFERLGDSYAVYNTSAAGMKRLRKQFEKSCADR